MIGESLRSNRQRGDRPSAQPGGRTTRHPGGSWMAEEDDHRGGRPPSVAETLRAPASPFALDTERRAALSLVLMSGFALGDLARLLDVFTSANELAERRAFSWEIVAISGRAVASAAVL